MKTKVKIAKRVLSILLVFLFSINSFAAIVSDNDGSAFVTKAEFNALKRSFSAQINKYNESIDGKIDGAIASYLAGMTLTTTETLKSGIKNLNNSAKDTYKWWTKTIVVDNSIVPKHGSWGGFGTITWGHTALNFTNDNKTVGFIVYRYSVGNTTYTQEDGTAWSANYFAWYPATDKRDASYYELSNGTYGNYLTGNSYDCSYYKGFMTSNMTNTVTMDPSRLFSLNGPTHNGAWFLWAHFPNNVCQYDDIGTNDSWNSQTFDLSWMIKGATNIEGTANVIDIKGWFTYGGMDVFTNPVTKDMKVLLINNYKRTQHVTTEKYYDVGVPIATDYSQNKIVAVNATDWDTARLDNTADREFIVPVTEHPRVQVAYWDSTQNKYQYENLSVQDASTPNLEKQIYIWKHHPYSEYNTTDLIDKDLSSAYGSALKPYEGAYITTPDSDGVIALQIKFHSRNGSSQQVKFAIREGKFTQATKLVPNIDTTYTTWTTNTDTAINIEFNAKKGKEYFIQVEPVTEGQLIGIEQIGDIQFTRNT